VALLDTAEPPVYQRIARKSLQLREFGMSDRAIAVPLGVTDKTATKAIRWLASLNLLEWPWCEIPAACFPRAHRYPAAWWA